MNWFSELISKGIRVSDESGASNLPEGLWQNCDRCAQTLYRDVLKKSDYVCHHCDHHMYISARERLESFLDKDTVQEHFNEIKTSDPLSFVDQKKYKDRIYQAQKQTKENDALIVATGDLDGIKITVVVFEYAFMAGSMGSAVGEKFMRAVHLSIEKNCPFICFAASGGARMQEGLFSLMQMSKTAAAIARLKDLGIPYISVLTNPTMGGVSASLAMLGHVNIAEPNALIGFAGPRVIEQTVNQVLPNGFQRSEFLLENGAIDAIIDRREMRGQLTLLVSMLSVEQEIELGVNIDVKDENVEVKKDDYLLL